MAELEFELRQIERGAGRERGALTAKLEDKRAEVRGSSARSQPTALLQPTPNPSPTPIVRPPQSHLRTLPSALPSANAFCPLAKVKVLEARIMEQFLALALEEALRDAGVSSTPYYACRRN